VISPPPENLSATAVGNSIHLSWEKVVCERAIGYDLYRRSGFYGLNPGPCETGIPEGSGYEKIATIQGVSDTTFIDTNNGMGLVHGIDYCYTVVAWFADGSESYPSQEACATLKKDVPIITNVSVLETSSSQGEIFVGWSKPTDMDTLLFGGPYKYVINRADSENPQFVEIAENNGINDTLFLDASGLNTASLKYSYRIDMYSLDVAGGVFIGSTQVARSMFLNITPTDQALELSWNIESPWNNYRYNIYRFNPQSQAFDSIGLSYTPFYVDTNLMNGVEYSYFVESFGNYSAPGLVSPIINLSQINSGIPQDNVPPCPPELSVTTDCQLIQNNLKWVNPPGCPTDLAGYYIYYSALQGDSLVQIDEVTDPMQLEYAHANLPSIAGCYQVAAYDSIGNFSERSNQVCVSIDSCSTYRLPNVFTPNQDPYNQYFRPYPDFTSVERIDMKIFNRWGRIVFETEDPEINWDGKNINNNQDCSEGVYFYVCDVFEIRLEGLSKRTLTGSVTLLR
jgi:gliding motility-associated-like protein